jgi:hypothetical protein
MEWFIPSLIVLVLAGVVVFFAIPKLSPYTLGVIAFIMFTLGVWQHYTMFPYEYKISYVHDLVKQYSGFLMLLGIIFVGIVGVSLMRGDIAVPPNVSSVLPAAITPNLSAITGSTNNKSIFNLGGNTGNKSIFNLGGIATNKPKGILNLGAKNNLASTSFKTV